MTQHCQRSFQSSCFSLGAITTTVCCLSLLCVVSATSPLPSSSSSHLFRTLEEMLYQIDTPSKAAGASHIYSASSSSSSSTTFSVIAEHRIRSVEDVFSQQYAHAMRVVPRRTRARVEGIEYDDDNTHDDGEDHVGYVIGVLQPGVSMSDLRRHIGHDDVHLVANSQHLMIPRHHRRAALIFSGAFQRRRRRQGGGGGGVSDEVKRSSVVPAWLRAHVENSKTDQSAAVRPALFTQLLHVPHRATSHLHTSLWPHAADDRSSCGTSSSLTTTGSTRVVYVHVVLSTEALQNNPGRPAVTAHVKEVISAAATSHRHNNSRHDEEEKEEGCKADLVSSASKVYRVRLTIPDVVDSITRAPLSRSAWIAHMSCRCAATLAALASSPFVRWVEPEPVFNTLNNIATVTMQDPAAAQPKHRLWEHGLTGEGQLLAVGDTGLDFDSCFFADRANDVAFWPNKNPLHRKVLSYQECVDEGAPADHQDVAGGHGTHVVGSAAGNSLGGNSQYNGMAIDAKVFFQDLTCTGQSGLLLPSDLEEYYTPAYDIGARVSSNSWGGDHPTSYPTTDRLTDKFLYEHQDYFVIVAAGNQPVVGILSPSSAKNVLAVGAHMNSLRANEREQLAQFSARGPSYDGRIKPELVAPGQSVTSALSDGVLNSYQCSTTVRMGTSMATPHVSGSAILLRQYLSEGWMPRGVRNDSARVSSPSAALMKALMLQAAVPMRDSNLGTAPNGMEGYGRLELDKLMFTNDDGGAAATFRWFTDRVVINQDQAVSFCMSVANSEGGVSLPYFVRATLTWTDAPTAMEGSSHSLINDLDLVIVGDDGSMYRGNTPADSVGGSWDRVGNVEQVTVTSSKTWKTFRVMVYGFDVHDAGRYNGQPFSLVVWGSGITHHAANGDGEDLCTTTAAAAAAVCPNSCSGIGSCVRGVCQCPASHHHVDCSQCNGATVCGGNGVCSFDKQCTCATTGHFSAADCTTCVTGWYGAHCDNDCGCSGPSRGSCDANGVCECKKTSTDGSCFDGVSCQYCCRDHGGEQCDTPSYWCVPREVRVINASIPGGGGAAAPSSALIEINGYGSYPNSIFCHWYIITPPAMEVEITVPFFSIEDPYDYVRIYDGAVGDGHELTRLTGREGEGHCWQSTLGRGLSITFFSDYAGPAEGFRMMYRLVAATSVPATTTTTTTTTNLPSTPTTTTTAAPVTTAAPTPMPTATECAVVTECANKAVACINGRCVCNAMYTGWRCSVACPTVRDSFGSEVTCNGRGQCIAPMQCAHCEQGFIGNGCQIDVVARRNDEDGGRVIKVKDDLHYSVDALGFPLPTNHIAFLGSLSVNSMHILLFDIPAILGTDNSHQQQHPLLEADWRNGHHPLTALRLSVVPTSSTSSSSGTTSVKTCAFEPELFVWTNLNTVGNDAVGAVAVTASLCLDLHTPPPLLGSDPVDATNDVVAIGLRFRSPTGSTIPDGNCGASATTTTTNTVQWALRIQARYSNTSNATSTNTSASSSIPKTAAASCDADPTYLSERLSPLAVVPLAPAVVDERNTVVVSTTSSSSLREALAAHQDGLIRSVLIGLLLGLIGSAIIVSRAMQRYRGFVPVAVVTGGGGGGASSSKKKVLRSQRRNQDGYDEAGVADEEAEDDMEDLELHNEAALSVQRQYPQGREPPASLSPIRQGALREASSRGRGEEGGRRSHQEEEEEEDELFPIAMKPPHSSEQHGGGGAVEVRY